MNNNFSNFNEYYEHRKNEIHDSIISFMATILKIPEDVSKNITWDINTVNNITDIAKSILDKLDADICDPFYIENGDTKYPCYTSDVCKCLKCPFKK